MGEMTTIERPKTLDPARLAVLDKVLSDIEQYGSLRQACERNDVEASSVVRWIDGAPELEQRYARARAIGYDNLAEQALHDATTANDPTKAGLIRIAFDARKWYLSKLASDKYGDKTRTELTGKDGAAIAIEQSSRDPIVSELAALLRQAKRPASAAGAQVIDITPTKPLDAPTRAVEPPQRAPDDISDLI